MATALNTQGFSLKNRGNSPQAIAYYKRALSNYESTGNTWGMAAVQGNIGLIHSSNGNSVLALEFLHSALDNFRQIDVKEGIANSLSELGSVYAKLGDHDKAMSMYCDGLALFEAIGNSKGMAAVMENMAELYFGQGDMDQAMDAYRRQLVLYQEIGHAQGVAGVLIGIGLIRQTEGDYGSAVEYCMEGYVLAEESGMLPVQRNACQCLYDAHKALGDQGNTLEFLERIQALDDSLQAEETAVQLEQWEFQKAMLQDSIAKAEAARRIEEAHHEEIKKKNQTRNWSLGAGLLALLLAGGFYSRWQYVRRSRDIISKERELSEHLLLNILPAEIAEELKERGEAAARDFEMVSILFTDFKGFTQASEKLSAADLVEEINTCFKAFDEIVGRYGI